MHNIARGYILPCRLAFPATNPDRQNTISLRSPTGVEDVPPVEVDAAGVGGLGDPGPGLVRVMLTRHRGFTDRELAEGPAISSEEVPPESA